MDNMVSSCSCLLSAYPPGTRAVSSFFLHPVTFIESGSPQRIRSADSMVPYCRAVRGSLGSRVPADGASLASAPPPCQPHQEIALVWSTRGTLMPLSGVIDIQRPVFSVTSNHAVVLTSCSDIIENDLNTHTADYDPKGLINGGLRLGSPESNHSASGWPALERLDSLERQPVQIPLRHLCRRQ